jgi:hypothetical protein
MLATLRAAVENTLKGATPQERLASRVRRWISIASLPPL